MIDKLLIALIRVYQLTLSRVLFALFGPVCRFEPSCSRYAIACLEGHGTLRGTLLSAKRLCKCHPFHPGGYDPPPPPRRPGRAHVIPSGTPPPTLGATLMDDATHAEAPAAEALDALDARPSDRSAAALAATDSPTKRHETAA
jgi:putative membrane protein insertion efficiency factor